MGNYIRVDEINDEIGSAAKYSIGRIFMSAGVTGGTSEGRGPAEAEEATIQNERFPTDQTILRGAEATGETGV